MKKLLTFLTLLTLFFTTAWAAESVHYTMTTPTNTSSSYAEGSDIDINGITWNVTGNTNVSPWRIGGKSFQGTRSIYSKTAMTSSISKIEIEFGGMTLTDIGGQLIVATDANFQNIIHQLNFSIDANSITTITPQTGTEWNNGAYYKILISLKNSTNNNKYIEFKGAKFYKNASGTTTYALNLPTGLTGGTVTATGYSDLTAIPAGTNMTVTATPATGYTLEWMKANGVEVSTPYEFVINATTTITASFVQEQASTTEWVLTSPSNLTTGDVVLIVDKYSSRAMSNDNGTSAAPSATSVTLNSNKDKVTAGVTAALLWEVTKTDNTFNFTVPNGDTHLYCTNTNNGVRVGTGNAKDFVMTGNGSGVDYLTCTGTTDIRYLGVYNNSDWRCYKSMGDNIASTVVAFYKKVETGSHTVTVGTITGEGTITPSSTSANTGDAITVTAEPATGYELTALAYNGTAIDITSTPYTFTMPDADVTLTATFSKIDYTITKGSMTNGTVNVAATANYGDVVTITPVPETDYVVDKVYYNDGTDHEIAVNNNAYTFTMPASNVTVWATFVEYYPTLRLAGRFNGRSTSSWITDNSGPEFTYDTSTEKYTIDAYFIGASQDEGSDVDFFYLRSDNDDLKANASGNCWVGANGGTYSLGGSSNFRIYPGVYNITVNKARTSITFTKITPVLTFSPNGGEVEAGQTVTVTSNLQTLVDNIKNTYDSGATGTVNHSVSTDQNNWDDNVTLNTIGSATVYGRAVLGNIYATGNAAYTVVAANTNTQYQLITSTNDLVAGKKYIIVSTGSYTASGTTYNFTKAAGSPNEENNLILDADVTISDDIVDLDGTSGVTEFTLGGSTGQWTFAFGDGTYLASSAAKSAKADESATPASISFSGNNATINMGSVGSFQYNPNNGNGRFAAYTSIQKPVMLFKQVEGTVTQKSAAPVITPEGGNIVGYSQEVEITQANGGTIYYTTDGTTPTESSAQYTGKFWAEGANLGDEVTITAVAKEDGKDLSNPVSVTYKFIAPVAPVFTPAGGTYTTAQEVSISSTTEGADVYYTTTAGLSAAQIVAQGTKFTTAINVSEETTYYAVTVYHDAHANRDALSSVRQAQYKFSEVESEGLPYTHPFTGGTGFGKFTTLDVNNPDEITVWTVSDDFGAKGTSFTSKPNTNHAATSWLLSPYINLGDAEEPVLTFKHQINKFFANPSTQATVWIKSYGGEWAQLTTGLPENSNGIGNGEWPSFDEEYDLSAYKGQIVQIGFKYDNPTAGSGAGTWEIQNFSVVDMNQPIIEVNNIAEFMDNEKVPADRKAKILNPVVVLYHYQQYHNDEEGDYVNDYIWVKDESGYAIIYGKYLDVNYTNGDVIPGGFTATKFYYNVGRFYQMYYPEGLQPATEKALADPEAVTLSLLNGNKDNYNGHYVTIPKMRIKFSSGKLVPYEYNFTTEESYGGQRNFEIGDATLSISNNNKSIIGYNNFDNPWLETLAYPEYENATSDYGDYNITGIFERYNGVWEFMPIIITPWEENKVTLHDLCQDGVVNHDYKISNNLLGVYASADGNILWVKDDNGQSIHSVAPDATYTENFPIEVDGNTRLEQKYYDQSNWCEIHLTGANAGQFEGKIIKGGAISGKFTNKLNPTMTGVRLDPETDIYSESSYEPNYYMPANFYGNQSCTTSEQHGGFFFMTPKPQEYAQVVWAIWNGEKMVITGDPIKNTHQFSGSFAIDLSMNMKTGITDIDALHNGTNDGFAYNFAAIIRKATVPSGAPMLMADNSASYIVYPLDLIAATDPATGINTVDVTGKAVKSVKFYNVAGIESATPFQGVNIVVTEYTDGTRSTSKVLRR